ncbi:MAG: GIY-YIG nuclease family protein [Lachnospiraceae bacterium]|nr:GIY-YIG nuclease family protein [Lachnospiraceae bacterium]
MADGYFVYLLRCVDGSLYTGITTDVKRRFAEHVKGGKKGAKYTKNHAPEKVAVAWRVENRSVASKFEWQIKHLTKQQKEALCEAPERLTEFVTVEEAGRVEVVREN